MGEYIKDRRLVLGVLLLGVIAVAAVMIVFSAVSEAAARNATQTGEDPGVSDLEASIQSLTPQASFFSGAGANFLGIKISKHGSLLSFESPAGAEAVFDGQEGYAVCSFSNAGATLFTAMTPARSGRDSAPRRSRNPTLERFHLR